MVSVNKQLLFRWGPKLMIAAFLLVFMGVAFFLLKDIIFGDKSSKKRVTHDIALIKPPPPPKPEEKPPEPEIKKEEVKLPEPEAPPPEQPENASQDEAPPSDNLGLDADGQAGSDGFGLGANKGGRPIIAGKAGGGGNRFAWYDGLVQKTIQDVLDRNKALDNQNYKVVVKIWLNPDGSVERFDLANSSGNGDVDKNIKVALREIRRINEPLPEGLLQPIKLRITSRQL